MDGLKQRVIGALVLVSLAVIFVPMLFDEPHSERSSRVIDIPEEPPFPEVEVPEEVEVESPSYYLEEQAGADEPSGREEQAGMAGSEGMAESAGSEAQQSSRSQQDSPQPENRPVPAEPVRTAPEPPTASEVQTAAPSQPASEPVANEEFTRSLAGAWVVQLGSFGNADNARRLRDNAREKGYSSHLQQVTRGDTVLTRVFCGPFAEKSEAERAKQVLDSAFGLNSLVTSGDK